MGGTVCYCNAALKGTHMKLSATNVEGVVRIDIAPIADTRGFFARSFCEETLADAGYPFQVTQANVSFNDQACTLRGLHYQDKPVRDSKIVRCERGAIWDVAVDLRPNSPTYLKWTGVDLSAENGAALLIPEGCAHGFITLVASTQVLYMMGTLYVPELARGVRWNDPVFNIEWPLSPVVLSDRDASYPDFAVR